MQRNIHPLLRGSSITERHYLLSILSFEGSGAAPFNYISHSQTLANPNNNPTRKSNNISFVQQLNILYIKISDCFLISINNCGTSELFLYKVKKIAGNGQLQRCSALKSKYIKRGKSSREGEDYKIIRGDVNKSGSYWW